MSRFVEIGQPVLERMIFESFFTIYGRGGHLGHVTVFTIYGRGDHLGHVTWIIYIHIDSPFS